MFPLQKYFFFGIFQWLLFLKEWGVTVPCWYKVALSLWLYKHDYSTTGMFVLSAIGDDLMRCVDLYNQAQSKWFEEMVTTSLVIKLILLHLNHLFGL